MAWDSLINPDGAPLGVSNKAWDRIRLFRAGGCLALFFGVAMTVMGFLGLATGVLDDDTAVVALGDAATHQGPARISGRLESSAPAAMPDDGTPVVRGRLRVTAAIRGSGNKAAASDRVFVEWNETAADAYLTDGTHRLPIPVPATIEGRLDRRARARVEHEPGRNGRPRAVEYGGQRYPVEVEDHSTRVTPSVERELVPHGQVVVLTGVIVNGALVASTGGVIRRAEGTVEEVAGNARSRNLGFACCGPFAVIMGLGIIIAGTIRLRSMRAMGAAGLLKKLL